ncbi:hypothetical protein ACA910_014526 [Epithemia clementina (nom. ined.)]
MPGISLFAKKAPALSSTNSAQSATATDQPQSGATPSSREEESSTRRVSFAEGTKHESVTERSQEEDEEQYFSSSFCFPSETSFDDGFSPGFLPASDPEDNFGGDSSLNSAFTTPAQVPNASKANGAGGIALFRGMSKPPETTDRPSPPPTHNVASVNAKSSGQTNNENGGIRQIPHRTAQPSEAVPTFLSGIVTRSEGNHPEWSESEVSTLADPSNESARAGKNATQRYNTEAEAQKNQTFPKFGDQSAFNGTQIQKQADYSSTSKQGSQPIASRPQRAQTFSLGMQGNDQASVMMPSGGNTYAGTTKFPPKFPPMHQGVSQGRSTATGGQSLPPFQSSLARSSQGEQNEPPSELQYQPSFTSRAVIESSTNACSVSTSSRAGNKEHPGIASTKNSGPAGIHSNSMSMQRGTGKSYEPPAVSNIRGQGLHVGRAALSTNDTGSNMNRQMPVLNKPILHNKTASDERRLPETRTPFNRSQHSTTPGSQPTEETMQSSSQRLRHGLLFKNSTASSQDAPGFSLHGRILPPATPAAQLQDLYQRPGLRTVTPGQTNTQEVDTAKASPASEVTESQRTNHSQLVTSSTLHESSFREAETEHISCRQETDSAIAAHSAKFDEQQQEHLMLQREFDDMIEAYDEKSLRAQVQLSEAHAEMLFILDDMADTQTDLDAIEAMALDALDAVVKVVPLESNQEN